MAEKLKLLLDINIYGLLVVDFERMNLIGILAENKALLIYGNPIIRKELRETPKRKVNGKNLRMELLILYDELVKKSINVSKEVEGLAQEYFKIYNAFGGKVFKKANV